MPVTPYTRSEVRHILELSERIGGHAGARHVNMSKDELWERVQDYKGSGLALRTSFLTFADMIEALTGVLNDSANDAELERFRVDAKAGDRGHFELQHARLPRVFKMQYGLGGGASTYPCQSATLVLHKQPSIPRGMRVVTFFGTMGRMV